MSRGGSREGAGRKSTWASGCTREDTVPVRVPKALKEKIWDYAHKLDAGEDLECVVNSLREENEKLKQELNNNSATQLSLFDVTQPYDKNKLIALRDQALKMIPFGTQSKYYKQAKKAFDYFIDNLNV